MIDNIVLVDKLRTTFIFYATIVGVLSFYTMIQVWRGKSTIRKGALWMIFAVWLQTFGDMAELYSRLGQPLTWRTPYYYVIYTIMMIGLVKLQRSSFVNTKISEAEDAKLRQHRT